MHGGGAAWAPNVQIQSMDPRGEMTFGEVSNATVYRVKWTTNLMTMGWSTSAPPGISAIPPTGFGGRSKSVDVARAVSSITSKRP